MAQTDGGGSLQMEPQVTVLYGTASTCSTVSRHQNSHSGTLLRHSSSHCGEQLLYCVSSEALYVHVVIIKPLVMPQIVS